MIGKWTGEKRRAEVTVAIRRLIKKKRKFTLLDVTKAINVKPVPKKYHLEVHSQVKKKIRELMGTAESETHPSLAHEVFESQMGYKVAHLRHLFGRDAIDGMLDYYIARHSGRSINEVAEELGMHRNFVFDQAKKSKFWRKWVESRKEHRSIVADASRQRQLDSVERKARRREESQARLKKKLAKKRKPRRRAK